MPQLSVCQQALREFQNYFRWADCLALTLPQRRLDQSSDPLVKVSGPLGSNIYWGMNMRRLCQCIALCVLLAAALTHRSSAEWMPPRTYYGYFTADRWGQQVLFSGPYHLFVSDAVAKQLARYQGKPLELQISKIDQVSHDAHIVAAVDKVTLLGSFPGLRITANATSKTVRQGEGVRLRVTLRNDSKKEIILRPTSLELVVVTSDRAPKSPPGYRGLSGTGYWYVQDEYDRLNPDGSTTKFSFACHEVRNIFSDRDLAEKGKGISLADKYPYTGSGAVRIAPRGEFEADIVAATDLPAGQYEVFVCLSTGSFSQAAGPTSKRLKVDVISDLPWLADGLLKHSSPLQSDQPEERKAFLDTLTTLSAANGKTVDLGDLRYGNGGYSSRESISRAHAEIISSGGKDHIGVVLVYPGMSVPGTSAVKLILFDRDGKFLDELSCDMNSRYGEIKPEVRGAPDADGTQIVLWFLPIYESKWHNYHEITHRGNTAYFTDPGVGGITRLTSSEKQQHEEWITSGLCRVKIDKDAFVVVFPSIDYSGKTQRQPKI